MSIRRSRWLPALITRTRLLCLWAWMVSWVAGDAMGAAPADRTAMMREAREHVRAGQLHRARAIYEILLARSPSDDEARAGLARIEAWSGKWAAAEKMLRDVLDRHPNDLDVRISLIDVLLWQRKWSEAREQIRFGLARDGGQPDLLEREARLELWTGHRARARAAADLAASQGAESASLAAMRATLYRGELRATGRMEFLGEGLPDLPSVDLALMLRDDRTTVRANTWQGLLLSTEQEGARQYNAAYGVGASRRVDDKTTLSADLGVGLPAHASPQLSVSAGVERPFRDGLNGRMTYAFRLYPASRQVHTLHPAASIALTDTVHVELRYWLTYFRFPPEQSGSPRAQGSPSHSVGAGLVLRPTWRAQYGFDVAHGAQVEVVGDDFRLIGLTSDTAFAWTEQLVDLRWGVRPRYGIERRSTDTGFVVWVHTAELGVFRRW